MKKLFTIILLALLCANAMAYDFSAVCSTGQTLYYNITSDVEPYTVDVVSENNVSPYYTTNPTGDLEIPETVEYNSITYSVTSIGDYAFYDCSGLTSVAIGNSVTSIGEEAFYGCSGLTEVTIPNSVTSIGWDAFYSCNSLQGNEYGNAYYLGNEDNPFFVLYKAVSTDITSCSINTNCKFIYGSAFFGCSGLETIVVESGNATYDSRDYCNAIIETATNTLLVGCKNTIIPSSVTSIGGSAFSGCSGLTSVTIPNSVTSIGSSAFSGCSGLSGELTIPDSVTNIGYMAFGGCNGLTSVTIGNSVTSIGGEAFAFCSSLTTVNFNATNCTSIGFGLPPFFECDALTTLNIGENVTNIPNKAFFQCTHLESLTIPNSVTSIGSEAFYACSSLTSVTIPNSVTEVGDAVFGNCRLTEPVYNTTWFIYFPNGYTTEYSIPNGIQKIAGYAFYECSGLTSVTIPNSVTSIGEDAFSGTGWYNNKPDGILYLDGWCLGYKGDSPTGTLTTAEGTKGIANVAFEACSGLTSVIIGNSVTSIGNYAFYYCNRLTSVTIGNSVTSIGASAFEDCRRLASVTIGNSVENIGAIAFDGCENITDIYILADTPPFLDDEDSFTDTTYTTATLWAPCGFADSYASTDVWSNFTNIQERRPYVLHIESSNLAMGTTNITHQPDCTDGMAIIEAAPNQGYQFVSWNDGNTNNPRTIIVTSDTTFVANFEANTYNITVLSNNDAYGMVSGGGTYEEGSTATISATPYQGYRFVSWNDGSTDNPRTITVTSDSTFVANFEANIYTITVLSNNDAYGMVSGGGTYDEGSSVVISAMPYEGYRFVQWNDGNTDDMRTITVTSDSTFVANFEAEQAQQYTITVLSNNDAYGSVSGSGTYDEGSTVTLTAMPYEGYNFVSWNDGDESSPRTIVVTSDSTFIADFVKCEITYTIDTVVNNFVTVGDHTFYSTGNYTFAVSHETACDTIYDINLTVLAEPVYDIGPNPTKSLLNINSDGFISAVEFYTTTGQLALRKEVNGYEAEFDVEGLVDGVYILRIYGEESSLPSVSKIIKE